MDTTLKVLLIEDSVAMGSLIQHVLTAAAIPFQVSWEKSLSAGVGAISSSLFDVILLDLSLPDSSGLETFRSVHRAAKGVPVVILSANEDEGSALGAVAEGAQDYLTKTDWKPESLARTLRYAVERNRIVSQRAAVKRGMILAFIGAKGGVGTTTTALNIAAALAFRDKSSIAIEFRPYRGTFVEHLEHKPSKTLSAIRGVPPASITPDFIGDLLVNTHPGLRVLHGPQTPVDLNAKEAEAALDAAATLADYIILDLPSSPGVLTETGVRKASFTSVVLDREFLTVSMAGQMISMVRSWGAGDSCIGALLVNRSSVCEGMSLAELRARLGCGLVGTVTPDPSRSPGFFNHLPVTIMRPDDLVACTATDVARRLASETGRFALC